MHKFKCTKEAARNMFIKYQHMKQLNIDAVLSVLKCVFHLSPFPVICRI